MRANNIVWFVVALTVFLLPLSSVAAGPASDKRMAEEALVSRIGKAATTERRDHRLSAVRLSNQRLLNRRPTEVLSATVIFGTGMFLEDLIELQQRPDVEIIDMVFKVPVGNKGKILTVTAGTSSLLKTEGDFAYRARMAKVFLKGDYQGVVDMMPEKQRSEPADVVSKPWLVYRIEIIGPVQYLVSLENRSDVALVVINEDSNIVQYYEIEKAQYEEAHKKKRDAIRQQTQGDG